MAERNPWPGLWSLLIGFFMILLDSTIVSVANPAIMRGLGLENDYAGVLWVTSAYLLAYAVPLLVTGRLGDRYGPKRVYLGGLILFTAASLACGLATTLPALVASRVAQGLGASMMSPQTMAIITRTFPPRGRGAAMGIWGSVAGIATLVGPILGGVLVDGLGWEWIFFVNVPLGVAAWLAVARNVPRLETHVHRFDVLGVVLSTAAMFLIVFGIQEGNTYHWGTISGVISVPLLIGAGVALLGAFVAWQALQRGEPLLPLGLLADRNFSLANTAISLVGFAVTCMPLPLFFYLQDVRGLSPTASGLLLAPTAVVSGALAPVVGRRLDRLDNTRVLVAPALLLYAAGLAGYVALMSAEVPVGWLVIPAVAVGAAMAGVWGPISTTATRTLPPRQAGAGSGVYNTTRQLGAVLGSAAVAAVIENRVGVHGPGAQAMAEAMLLPVGVVGLAAAVTLAFVPAPAASGSRER